MKELIRITEKDGKQAVSARELHAFLGNKKQYTDWMKDRIRKYGLVENEDYVLISLKSETKQRGGDRRSVEYILSVDCAKELAMVEGNAKGRQARQYFIECEKQLQKVYEGLPLSNQLKELKKKINALAAKMDTPELDVFTVYGFAALKRKRLYGSEAVTIGKQAVKLCKKSDMEVGKVKDSRFGWVNVYPESVLEEVFEEHFKQARF